MSTPWFVLIGGESMEHQGPDFSKRGFLHTSLTHIGIAYDKLRTIGIAREHIIVIVQLNDFLASPHVEEGNYAYSSVMSSCARLIEEGGADYDYDMVNPGTVWSVLSSSRNTTYPRVVPKNASAIFFGIYSHGDAHPSSDKIPVNSPFSHMTHEWFAHMPYPTKSKILNDEMLSFISTNGACRGNFHTPQRYLYVTQLRQLFIKMFSDQPNRPIVGLLNYCLSGSCQEFMKRPASRQYYGTDRWPLFLMSASQSHQDALIGGLWTAFFHQLEVLFSSTPDTSAPRSDGETSKVSLGEFFQATKASYFRQNVYELYGHVAHRAYAATSTGRMYSRYPIDLKPLLCGGDGGEPDYEGIRQLQHRLRQSRSSSEGIKIWLSNRWMEKEADLADVVRQVRCKTAIPDAVFGEDSGISQVYMKELFFGSSS